MKNREPDFENLLKVLKKQKPDRPTLFEFFLNKDLYEKLAGPMPDGNLQPGKHFKWLTAAFKAAGYDYVTYLGADFKFEKAAKEQKASKSMDDVITITGRKDFEKYNWPDPKRIDYSVLEQAETILPEGMKIIVNGPGGVLENVVELCGYEGLCYMRMDDEALVQEIFDAVGAAIVSHYEQAVQYTSVGACISNDDWGFKTQTMLSTEDMRKFVIPWHKKIAEVIHTSGKPVILHSCGNLEFVMDDIIDEIGYDGKHSYEDTIMPVEQAYDKYHQRVAIMGGIDLDFLCRASIEEIKKRCLGMLDRASADGAYALGSGNSIPAYCPAEKYFAMTECVRN